MDTLEVIYSEFLSHTNNCNLLTLVGLVTTILCLITLIRVLVWTPFKLYFLAQVLPGVDLKKLGKWAVITGATGGIGKGYCKVLAEKGMNIVLISRSSEKLAKVAEEIREAYGVVVRTLTADFHSTDIYERIEEELRELDVGVLVNNVGTSNVTATFLKTTNILQTTTDILHVNCVSMTNMCAIVLPQMLHKDKGVIINISSIGRIGFLGAPVYSSSKSYVSKLSECLQRTYRNSGKHQNQENKKSFSFSICIKFKV
ncbi:HSD17B12 [Bugula neritina]|uniref:HSD17B12 n=1 Tax=Bugula neritina TaxID=10212 RepID=A0A7J7IUY9_BUGNE|nr:HSD17B12 [Bugula neritina]